ncbi:microsomal glutathione S-transferase 1-like isoform X1 [Lucilia cuprina]|uniref:microsomal glutathione S-transferase 1-like isoform X1 n=1 Tax=Lucilia cuprina TaxID=7375 RepID=UPI000C71B838|nr:microsomal glutathione S-transferase 1-like isoform X1 [Lucilia cuprina]
MSASVIDLLTLKNEVFKSYLFWSGVLALKMIIVMPLLTGIQRFTTHTFANPEDLLSKKDKVKFDDPNVERVRRAHRNDMENILPFFAIGFLYVLTNPASFLAVNLFRAVALARIAHTLVYAVVVVPQPARAISFFVALAATAYMAVRVLIFAL